MHQVFFLFKELVYRILSSNTINFDYLDDVMIGDILKNQTIINIPRYDIIDSNKAEKNINAFHIRIKTTNRDLDSLLMYDLNKFKTLKQYILN
jgi:hypothetical protein